MLEDLQDGFYDLRSISKDSQGLFGAAPKYTFRSRHAQAVDNVFREAERDTLRDREKLAL